jgi:hypothetical protein
MTETSPNTTTDLKVAIRAADTRLRYSNLPDDALAIVYEEAPGNFRVGIIAPGQLTFVAALNAYNVVLHYCISLQAIKVREGLNAPEPGSYWEQRLVDEPERIGRRSMVNAVSTRGGVTLVEVIDETTGVAVDFPLSAFNRETAKKGVFFLRVER